MRCSIFSLVVLSLSVAVSVVPSAAQQRSGSITGTVRDRTQSVLPGAQIEVLPGSRSLISNAQGEFTFIDMAPGDYTLSVSYMGFVTFSSPVTVSEGQVVRRDATLQIGTQNESMTVRGDRQFGELEAINIERTADNIVQVLPSDVITSLPNTNIADAVGRLPSVSLERDEGEGKYIQIRGTEPRLSNVTINGIHVPSPESVRNVKLDAIPADLVDLVEVNKTLSANQDADADWRLGGPCDQDSGRSTVRNRSWYGRIYAY